MAQLVQRITVVVNRSKNVVVELKESRRFAPDGIYSYKIKLPPSGHKNIPATFFHQRAVDSSRPTIVKIFVDGVYSNVALTPQDFIHCICIIVGVDENGEVRVSGIKATTWRDQVCRIGYVILYNTFLQPYFDVLGEFIMNYIQNISVSFLSGLLLVSGGAGAF